jgi:hypothetical protein
MSFALPSVPFPPKLGQVFAWDGTKLEPVPSIRATRDKIGLWGVEPVVQPAHADQAAPAAIGQHSLTDNGGGTADQTVASMAAAVMLTDNTGLSGSHDDTLAAVTTFTPSVAWDGATVYPSAADATAIATAITVLNQNASDLAQKVIELVTWQTTMQNNFKEVTTELALIKTDIANSRTYQVASRTALVNSGIIKGSA